MSDRFQKLEQGKYYHIYNRGINSCALFEQKTDYQHFLLLHEKYIVPVADTIAWVLMPNHFHFLLQIKEDMVYKYSMEYISNAGRSNDADRLEIKKWETVSLPDGTEGPSALKENVDPSALKENVDPSALKENVDPSALKGNVDSSALKENVDPSALKGNVGPSALKENVDPSALKENVDPSALKGNVDPSALKENVSSSANADRSCDPVRLPNPTKHLSHLFNAYTKYYNAKYKRHGALFERPFKRKLIDSEQYLKQLILYIHNNPVNHGFVNDSLDYSWSSYLDYLNATNEMLQSYLCDYFGDINNFKVCHQGMGLNDLTLE